MRIACLLVLAAGFCAIAQAPPSPAAKTVELCDVVKSPASFSGQLLEIRGVALGTDPNHAIVTGYCQFGVGLAFSQQVRTHEDVRQFYKAVLRGNPGTTDRDISGAFVGVFHYEPKDGSYFLEVERVDDLKAPPA